MRPSNAFAAISTAALTLLLLPCVLVASESNAATTTDDDAAFLVHVHVPKTGGSSVRQFLRDVVGEDAIFATGLGRATFEALAQPPQSRKTPLRAAHGHFGYGMHLHPVFRAAQPRAVHYATVLRDPVARIVSQFQWEVSSPMGILLGARIPPREGPPPTEDDLVAWLEAMPLPTSTSTKGNGNGSSSSSSSGSGSGSGSGNGDDGLATASSMPPGPPRGARHPASVWAANNNPMTQQLCCFDDVRDANAPFSHRKLGGMCRSGIIGREVLECAKRNLVRGAWQ